MLKANQIEVISARFCKNDYFKQVNRISFQNDQSPYQTYSRSSV